MMCVELPSQREAAAECGGRAVQARPGSGEEIR